MLKIKRLHPDAIVPKRAYEHDSGLDLFAVDDVVLDAGKRVLFRTGWAMQVPIGYEIQIRSKSGLALNHGVVVLNSPSTIDRGFSGEVKVILFNTGARNLVIQQGQKIAQIVIAKVELWEPVEMNIHTDTSRGDNGFGSTGR